MMVLFILVLLLTLVGLGMIVVMQRRDEPLLGLYGLAVLLAAGLLGSVYGTIAAA
jgi:hypothetical protein